MIPNLVSVIIPNYNSGAFVTDAVISAISQSYAKLEVIVIDDGSTDNSVYRLAPLASRIRTCFGPNRGLSMARNRGIELSRGEFIAFLDADDVWMPNKIAKQVQRMHDDDAVGLVHTDFHFQDSKTGLRWHRNPCWGSRYTGRCAANLFMGNQLCVSGVMVRRRCLENDEVFDNAIKRCSTQDYELWLSLSKTTRFSFIRERLLAYQLHDNNASHNERVMLEDELYVVEKHAEDLLQLGLVNKKQVDERLFDLQFSLGYLAWERKDNQLARKHFAGALAYRPRDRHTRILQMCSHLPDEVIGMLRRMKAGVRRIAVNPSMNPSMNPSAEPKLSTPTASPLIRS